MGRLSTFAATGLVCAGLGAVTVVQPVSVHAATVNPNGTSSANTVALSVNPAALITLPSALVSGLAAVPSAQQLIQTLDLQHLTGLTTVGVGSSDANGTEPAPRGDLAGGHADALLLKIHNGALAPVLANLNNALPTLVADYLEVILCGTTTLPSSAGQSCQANTILADLPAPFNVFNTDLFNGLQVMVTNIKAITNLVTGGLTDATRGVAADLSAKNALPPALNLVGVNTGQSSSVATAATKAAAPGLGAPSAVAQGVHSLATLGIAQPLTIGNIVPTAAQILNQVVNAPLNAIINFGTVNSTNCSQWIAKVQAGLTAGQIGAVLTGALAPLAGSLGLACNTLSALLPGLVTAIQGAANTALTTLDASVLATLQSSLIEKLPAQLQAIGTGSLLNITALTSVSTLAPKANGVDGASSVGFDTLQVGNLLSGLGSAVPNLLELDKFGASSHAFVDGIDTSPPSGTASLGTLKVLGQVVPLPAQGTSQTLPVTVPGLGTVSVTVTIGAPFISANTPQHKAITTSLLDVAIANGDAGGANPVLALGGSSGKVLDLGIVTTAVDAATDVAVAPAVPTTSGPTPLPQNPLQPTGIVGPTALAAALLLGGAGVALQVGTRRRRNAGSNSPGV